MSSTVPLVAPIRFSGGGLSLQSTISRVSAEGLFIRSLVSPRSGAQMELSLSLPNAARPLQITGKVGRRPADAGKDSGFWVGFEQMSEEARAFLDSFLRGKGSEGFPRPRPRPGPAGAEGRAFPRVEAQLRVGWKSSREFLSAWSLNLSCGGIFIATETPPALREVVELSITLPDGKPPVKSHAEVVHCVTPEQAEKTGEAAGAGLQFLDSDDDFRARLNACVEALRD
jgi:uncharacterized protein (TIGR02266 family)